MLAAELVRWTRLAGSLNPFAGLRPALIPYREVRRLLNARIVVNCLNLQSAIHISYFLSTIFYFASGINPLASLANRRLRLALSPYRGRAVLRASNG